MKANPPLEKIRKFSRMAFQHSVHENIDTGSQGPNEQRAKNKTEEADELVCSTINPTLSKASKRGRLSFSLSLSLRATRLHIHTHALLPPALLGSARLYDPKTCSFHFLFSVSSNSFDSTVFQADRTAPLISALGKRTTAA